MCLSLLERKPEEAPLLCGYMKEIIKRKRIPLLCGWEENIYTIARASVWLQIGVGFLFPIKPNHMTITTFLLHFFFCYVNLGIESNCKLDFNRTFFLPLVLLPLTKSHIADILLFFSILNLVLFNSLYDFTQLMTILVVTIDI